MTPLLPAKIARSHPSRRHAQVRKADARGSVVEDIASILVFHVREDWQVIHERLKQFLTLLDFFFRPFAIGDVLNHCVYASNLPALVLQRMQVHQPVAHHIRLGRCRSPDFTVDQRFASGEDMAKEINDLGIDIGY